MTAPLRVAVLGAGPAGLAAAWGLTEEREDGTAPNVQVTVYERSWRAGGKCASTRLPPSHRIVQNGTHYMFGVYFNTLAMVEQAFQKISDPRFGGVDEYVPRTLVGLKQLLGASWKNWKFKVPPRGSAWPTSGPGPAPDPAQHLVAVFSWLKGELDDYGILIDPDGTIEERIEDAFDDLPLLESDVIGSFSGDTLAEILDLLIERAGDFAADSDNAVKLSLLKKALEFLRWLARTVLGSSSDATVIRARILIDFVTTLVCGVLDDGVLTGQIADLDAWDFAEWLTHHGAQIETVEAPLTTAWYDVVAAYENGDPARPRLSAAAVLQTVVPAIVSYRGAYLYQMKPEVGEALIAPIYAALRKRGVEFRFLHELREIEPNPEGTKIVRLLFDVPRLEGQSQGAAETALADYEPLAEFALEDGTTRVYWPPQPKPPFGFMGGIGIDKPLPYRACGPKRDPVEKTVGGPEQDFDRVVFAIPHVLVPAVAPKLMEQKPAWKDLAFELPAVETQSLRLWLTAEFEDIAWDDVDTSVRPVVSAFDPHFTTWEDSGQQLELHTWSDPKPKSIATVFGPLKARRHPFRCQFLEWAYEIVQRGRARKNARDFLEHHAGGFWPGLVDGSGDFKWDALVPTESPADGLHEQWVVANTGALERYTHAAPGTFQYRLRSLETGYDNLGVAGEWTRFWPATANIELAVISGLRVGYDLRGLNVPVHGEGGFFPS